MASLSLDDKISRLLSHDWRGEKRISGLQGSAKAYAVFLAARRLDGPLLVLTPTVKEAEALFRDLLFFLGEEEQAKPLDSRAHLFPGWDILPFESLSPNPDHMAARMEGLHGLARQQAPVVVATPAAVMQRVVPRGSFHSARFVEGQDVDRGHLLWQLANLGFARAPLVEERGDFSVRGGIVDLFPPGYGRPVRLEFADDRIESIREFDPRTQRSRSYHEELVLLPIKEFTAGPGTGRDTLLRIEERADELGFTRKDKRALLESVREGVGFAGMEFLVPYFYDRPLPSLLDHLPRRGIVWCDQPARVEEELERFEKLVVQRAAKAAADGRFHAPAEAIYIDPDGWREEAAAFRQLHGESLDTLAASEDPTSGISVRSYTNTDLHTALTAPQGAERSLAPLVEHLEQWRGQRVLFVASHPGDAQRLQQLLAYYDVDLPISERSFQEAAEASRNGPEILLGDLTQGIRLPDEGLVLVTLEELWGRRKRDRSVRKHENAGHFITSLSELRQDDVVVHLDQGIGIYRGLKYLKVAGTEGEFLHLEYQGGDRLYLPIDRINLVQKFIGADGAAPVLDRLGGTSWLKLKARTRKSVVAMAKELLRVYAAREVHEGHTFPPPDQAYREFEAAFEYDETPDQEQAIADTLKDMTQSKPMDRLICGDVGYGKTEVAMRAAFTAVMDGRQVAVLAPTTILTQQHLETFRARFEPYPVRVESLSRFVTGKTVQESLKDLANGLIDVVIGTHRLLQKDVAFKNLGLVVIDEEHRFGVGHKEKLKQLRATVDVMSLTATPIPRTLHMSLSGIRDLSVIETAPPNRLAVRTYVTRYDEGVIRDAILREINREGQVFFLHNRVESIQRTGQKIMDLVPEARVTIAHGQMTPAELKKSMDRFHENEAQVLVCSAIIESGLDYPNANTIIINRADRFGLAQLYQLRGRVGRSSRRAYAYLLLPAGGTVTKDAEKRLRALQELDELGSGFKLALHDLEIRGAGNLLGREQSGQIAAVGFELYTQMMEETIHELKGEERRVAVEPEIRLGIPAYFPDDYMPSANQRLLFYKRLANLEDAEQLAELRDEIRDRYGHYPEVVENLFQVMELRRALIRALATQIIYQDGRMSLNFHATSTLDVDRLLKLAQEDHRNFRFSPGGRLSYTPDHADWPGLIHETCELLHAISQDCMVTLP